MTNLQLQARNHHVDLFRNVEDIFDEWGAPREEVVLYSEECLIEFQEDKPVGALLAQCRGWPDREGCREVWEVPDKPRQDWWLCPNRCNLSERVAARILRQMASGERRVDPGLAEQCQDYLRSLRAPKRLRAWSDLVDVDPFDWLAACVQRQIEWGHRHSEWTPELEAAYRDFE